MRIALVGPFTGASLSSGFALGAASQPPLPPGYPGAPLMTTLARALVECGHEVAAISTCYSSPVAELEPFRHWPGQAGRELDIYFCPQRPRSFRGSGAHRGRALDAFGQERRWLQAAIAHFQPELIHAHWTYEFAWAALDSGVPTLATAHDSPAKVLRYMPNLYRLVRYLMARRVIGRARQLTAVSPDLAADLQAWAPAPISVVANPIARSILAGPGCTPEAHASGVVAMVCNGWIDLKNGKKALRAFKLAREADPSLRLICFGADHQPGGPAQRWADAEGCAAGVEFRGPTPHAAILEQLRASFALLHASRLEACNMSIGEAMSVGLPVIAGERTGGVRWQLDEGRAGVLVDIESVPAMAAALGALRRDAARWQALSRAARMRAGELFALEPIVERYLALYREVLSHAGAAMPTAAAPA